MGYFRDSIEQLAAYTPGEQPSDPQVIKLNTNENAYPPSPQVIEAVRAALSDRLRQYPDPLATRFRQAAAHVLDVPPDWIIACNGSDEALTLLARATCDRDDLTVSPTPSYPLYETLARIQGCRFELRPFTAAGRLPEHFTSGARLALVPNPNSPTGTMVTPDDLLSLAESSSGLVVADEAYVDFADKNALPLVGRCERLVVTRSLSKGYSLAGIRFGFLVAQPKVRDMLIKLKDSYNVDHLSIAAAAAAIADQAYVRENVRKIRATRERLAAALQDLGFVVTPSHGNFVWARRPEPLEPIYLALKERKILVRYLRYASTNVEPKPIEGLRITVGTDAEIDRLLAELRSLG